MTQKYYSTSEAAKILRVSRVAIFKQIKTGKIGAEKIGRNYVIPQEQEVVTEALGHIVGASKKENIEAAIKKALREYGETFKRLGRLMRPKRITVAEIEY